MVITIDSGVRNLLFDQDDRLLAISRIIVPLGGFGKNLSVVYFKAPMKLKPCVFIDFYLCHLFPFQSLG
jgi:hypothetical protein